MSLTELEKKGVLETLAYLHKKGKATRTDLKNNIHAVLETLYKTTLPTLKQLELIHETRKKTFPYTVEIWLTEKGTKVATKVTEIQKILEAT